LNLLPYGLLATHRKQIGVLETPERPGSLAFGGADNRTLYIGARGSLYSIRMAAPGR
jgi:gluconolactonase